MTQSCLWAKEKLLYRMLHLSTDFNFTTNYEKLSLKLNIDKFWQTFPNVAPVTILYISPLNLIFDYLSLNPPQLVPNYEDGDIVLFRVISLITMIVFESEVLEPSRAFVVITLAILQGQRCRRDRGSHSLLSSNHPGGLQILLAFAYPLGAETGGEAKSQQVQGLPSSPVTSQTCPNPCHVLDLLRYLKQPARDGHQPTD